MNNPTEFNYKFWITDGRRRICKNFKIPAKFKRDADKTAQRIIKAAYVPGNFVHVNLDDVEQCRQRHVNKVGTADRIPVIVYVYNNTPLYSLNVEFWTPLMLTVGRCTHTNGVTSIFLDYLKK